MRAARADIDLERHRPQHRGPGRPRGAGRGVRGGQGRRLRARRHRRGPGRARGRRRPGWPSRSSRRPRCCARPASPRPILILSQPRLDDFDAAVHYDLRLTVYSAEGIEAASAAAIAEGKVARLHLKVNTGMNRVGAAPGDVLELAKLVERPARARARGAVDPLRGGRRARPPLHRRAARRVRRTSSPSSTPRACGRRCCTPPTRPPPSTTPRPASTSCGPASRSTASRRRRRWPTASTCGRPCACRPRCRWSSGCAAGERVSYGLRHEFDRATTVVTVPIGYADGVPRRLSAVGGEVLIGGRRVPDRRRGHHGPAHGRRRRPRGRGRRRGRAHRRAGDADGDGVERIIADDWAGPARHDRLRGRVRHRPPGAPLLPPPHHAGLTD